jgi:hypothetical protein
LNPAAGVLQVHVNVTVAKYLQLEILCLLEKHHRLKAAAAQEDTAMQLGKPSQGLITLGLI